MMNDTQPPFETCAGQCDYTALKARIYFLEKENLKLKDNVARLMIRCIDMENAEEKLMRIKLYLEEAKEVDGLK
jgi:hypothetical protein